MGSRSFGQKRKLLISAVLALHLSTHIVSLDFDAVQLITLYTMIVIFVSLWVKAQLSVCLFRWKLLSSIFTWYCFFQKVAPIFKYVDDDSYWVLSAFSHGVVYYADCSNLNCANHPSVWPLLSRSFFVSFQHRSVRPSSHWPHNRIRWTLCRHVCSVNILT